MSSDRIIVDTIKVAQDLLLQNLPPAHNLTDAATVMRFRELVRSTAIRLALDRSSDTLLTFALRAVERVISERWDFHRTPGWRSAGPAFDASDASQASVTRALRFNAYFIVASTSFCACRAFRSCDQSSRAFAVSSFPIM